MKCLNWNLEWKTPAGRAGRLMRDRFAAIAPDVACLTEVVRSFVPEAHTIESSADYGYPNDGGRRRKVILWSTQPWTEVDSFGNPELPSGRFVSGITGGVRYVGVCIPWRDAHVITGRRDRGQWQDHISFCRGLQHVLEDYSGLGTPICVVGDFNQRIPRVSQPEEVARALAEAIPDSFTIATSGMKDAGGDHLIDHFAVSSGLSISVPEIVPKHAGDGTRLSDHVGVVACLALGHTGERQIV
jgi:exonuclease III